MPSIVDSDVIRSVFSEAMSQMYCQEVPVYGDLVDLVATINQATLARDSALAASNGAARLEIERHGAIRLGTAVELNTMRRVLAVMGMQPVGYYDLAPAGVPVHSTAFRAVDAKSLHRNPFRLFTSLLRLELVPDPCLREQAKVILQRRQIFSTNLLRLTALHESAGGLDTGQANEFVAEALRTFRWESQTTVSAATYQAFHATHRLLADVVCFQGPHINHLTPRTLDIDAAQEEMLRRGIDAKDVIEGPPPRKYPILLRQTSFKALEENVLFAGGERTVSGSHAARFGEIEQRGAALTPKGRALYDRLLVDARTGGATGACHAGRLAEVFSEFPDDDAAMRREELAFFRFTLTAAGDALAATEGSQLDLEALIAAGYVRAEFIVYEDFLPVSAAGIFQSNLGSGASEALSANSAQAGFEAALGCAVADEMALYAHEQATSLARVMLALRGSTP